MTNSDVPLSQQQKFWNDWNIRAREERVGEVSQRQAEIVIDWLDKLGTSDADILDAGCGTGWFVSSLTRYGRVTGTDLADAPIERARERVPDAKFLVGDIMTIDLPKASYDVIVCFEVLSHVADQAAFIRRMAGLLKPDGRLMLATQNRFVLERCDIPPPGQGQLRHWVTRRELVKLLKPHFKVLKLTTATPNRGHSGILRLLNSPKLNASANAVFGDRGVTRVKEAMGLGWSIMVHARLQ